MKWRIALAVLFVALALVPVSVDAAPPDLQPWMVAAASQGIGGSTPEQVQKAFGNFQNARAAQFNWDTPDKWHGNYEDTVTQFLHNHGCVTCGIADGQLTYPMLNALPIGVIDFIDILPVSFRQYLK